MFHHIPQCYIDNVSLIRCVSFVPLAAISFLSSTRAADASDQSSVSTSPCTNILVAVRHRMFILWFSLMFSFSKMIKSSQDMVYILDVHPPKYGISAFEAIQKYVNDCQFVNGIQKKGLPRHFASTIRPCCPSIDRDMCCPFIAAELMKAFASADLQSELI